MQGSVVWRVVHDSLPEALWLVLSDVTVFGVTGRPAQLLVNGRRWNSVDWHYNATTQVCHGTGRHIQLELFC